jgi:two-component system response regulator YesN
MRGLYKVLLADDEILDLEGMRTFIPWDQLDMKVVDAVTNGFAAYKVIEQEEIDVLVTDVRMPNMSGLELARKALEKRKNLRIIFVSGHQDFNYVKQALSLNACSYVLKPMDDQELIQSLNKIRHELDLDKSRQVKELAYRHMVPIVKNEYLLKLLEGSIDHITLEVLRQEYGMKGFAWPGLVAVMETDDLSWKLNPFDDKEKDELLADFFGTVITLCRNKNIVHVCKITKQRLAMLLDRSIDLSAVEQIITCLNSKYPFTVTVGVGVLAKGLAELQESYRQAVEALDFKIFHGKGKIINSNEVRAPIMEDAKNLDFQFESLLSAMSKYNLVQIYHELDEMFKLSMNMRSKFTVQNFAMYSIMKLDEHLHTMDEDLFQMLNIELKNLDILLQFETVDDIRSWLRRRLFEISEKLHLKKQKKNWKLIQDIIRYVTDHLDSTISLRNVANQFSFSPNYLGQLFKEETGRNFSEYVVKLRMEKASQLLKDRNLKIYEVANSVGYRYLPYFSRQFKETFGLTPVEYKRKY